MKKTILFFCFSLIVNTTATGQNLLKLVVKDNCFLIYEEAYALEEANSFLYDINDNKMNKYLFENFSSQIEETKKSEWYKSDFVDKLIISENKKIKKRDFSLFSKKLTVNEKKILKYQIKHLNSKKEGLRSFPLKVSKPLFSKDNKFAILGILYGNESGEYYLFEKVNDKWEIHKKLSWWKKVEAATPQMY
uniref:hypothetical protein n=1 Tax=Flavobacterium sp. TaxID=239 RepID=UPI00404BA3CC